MNTASINLIKNKKHKSFKDRIRPLMFIGPHLLFFLVFFIIPFFFGIFISFTSWNVDAPFSEIKFVGFNNFKNILSLGSLFTDEPNEFAKNFFGGLKYTALFTVVMVPLLIIVPLLFAIILNKLKYGRNVVQAILYASSILSVSTVALTWRWMFDYENGFFNNYLFVNNPIKFTTDYAWICIFIFTLWAGVGGNMIIYLAGLSGISKEYYEAASIDGANGIQSFFHITIPGLKFQLVFTLVMGTIGAFNVYGQPAMFGVVQDKWVLMQHIQNYAFGERRDIGAGYASAMSVTLGLIISVFSIIQFKMMKNKND